MATKQETTKTIITRISGDYVGYVKQRADGFYIEIFHGLSVYSQITAPMQTVNAAMDFFDHAWEEIAAKAVE